MDIHKWFKEQPTLVDITVPDSESIFVRFFSFENSFSRV